MYKRKKFSLKSTSDKSTSDKSSSGKSLRLRLVMFSFVYFLSLLLIPATGSCEGGRQRNGDDNRFSYRLPDKKVTAAAMINLSPQNLTVVPVEGDGESINFTYQGSTDRNNFLIPVMKVDGAGLLEAEQALPVAATVFPVAKLPACAEKDLEEMDIRTFFDQKGTLVSLIGVRVSRTTIKRQQIMKKIKDFPSAKLTKIETGFGLIEEGDEPIENLNEPFTMVERLFRVYHALNTYSLFRELNQ